MISTVINIIKVKLFGKSIPIYCHWEITYRCNRKCGFCTLLSDQNIWTPELSKEQARQIILQLKKMGTSIIHFVGGEPTLRDDLVDLVDFAKKLNIVTAITTNGFIRKKDLELLKKVDYVRVSLTEKIDDKFESTLLPSRMSPISTLKKLVEYGFKPEIATTISSKTMDSDIDFILDFARQLNIKVGFNFVGVGVGNLKGFNPIAIEKRRDELKALILPIESAVNKINDLYEKNKDIVVNSKGFLQMVIQGGLGKYGCRAMDTAICIKANGAVSMPCIEFPLLAELGDINKMYYGESANEIRRKQGNFWFCNQCTMSCMYSASSLLDIKQIISMGKRYVLPFD